jgi:hypothetical protein
LGYEPKIYEFSLETAQRQTEKSFYNGIRIRDRLRTSFKTESESDQKTESVIRVGDQIQNDQI